MKDMGEARYVLGVEIVRNCPEKLSSMCQEAYIKRVLERFRMHHSKPVDTPVEKGLTLSLDQYTKTDQEKEKMKDVPYANAVGSLMYAMLYTLPDICFAVGLVSRYLSNQDLLTGKRIMSYLRSTTDLVLCYQGVDLKLRRYSDVD